MHADAFVQRDRTGLVLGIDIERDARRAAPPELGERPGQQGFRDPLAAPGRPHADRADVSATADARIVAGDAGQFISVADDEPDGAFFVPVLALATLEPFLERIRVPLPVLGERLVQRVVKGLVLVVTQFVHHEPGGKRRLRRLLGQLDRHLVEAPYLVVAVRLEESTGGGVGLGSAHHDLLHSLCSRELLTALEDLRSQAAPLGGNDAAGVRRVPVHAVRSARDQAAVLLPHPRLLAVVEVHEDVRAGDAPWAAVETVLLRGDERCDGRRVFFDERTEVHTSSFSQTTCSESITMPTLSYSVVAPVVFSESTPRPTRRSPRR